MEKDALTKIQLFLLDRGYTYSASDILESYLDYYKKGYYISHTMEDCINNLKKEIEELLEEKS